MSIGKEGFSFSFSGLYLGEHKDSFIPTFWSLNNGDVLGVSTKFQDILKNLLVQFRLIQGPIWKLNLTLIIPNSPLLNKDGVVLEFLLPKKCKFHEDSVKFDENSGIILIETEPLFSYKYTKEFELSCQQSFSVSSVYVSLLSFKSIKYAASYELF